MQFSCKGGAGFNDQYGLLGSNYTNDDSVKLFPRIAMNLSESFRIHFSPVQAKI